jgi:hypothetical protein
MGAGLGRTQPKRVGSISAQKIGLTVLSASFGLGRTRPRHQGWARKEKWGGNYFPPPILLHAERYSICMQEKPIRSACRRSLRRK